MAQAPTPLDLALTRVGDRWTLLVVDALEDGPARFTELHERLPGIATNILSNRLKRLEEEGLVVGRQYSERPPRSSYELTEPGRELAAALRMLATWASRHRPEGRDRRHELCGTTLETRWYCPTCDRGVESGDEEITFV